METKRCAYCNKLQRIESRVCSRCGHSFERHRSKGGSSWRNSVSLPSLPAASPHHAGHYSGLHPEDQPYQSNKIVTPQRFMQEMQEEKPLQQEPRHIVLPTTQHAPSGDRYSENPQAPTRKQIPLRRSRLYPVTDKSLPGSCEADETEGQDRPTQQLSRPFMREVLTATEQPQRAGTVEVESAPTFAPLTDTQKPQKMQDVDSRDSAPELLLEDEPFSATNDVALSLEDLPSYLQEGLRTNRWSSRTMSAVVLAASFCVLLITSAILLVWMGSHPRLASGHPEVNVTPPLHTPEVSTNSSTAPHLRLSAAHITFGPSASGVTSSQTITLVNSGGGQAVWQESSDQLWLTASSKSGTFTSNENIQITVNRAEMAPGDYPGQMKFWLQGQENTPSVLNVTMTVAPIPAQLSVSTTSLSYSTVQSQIPESQVITISNTGEQALHWDATVSTRNGAPWLRLSLLHGVLSSGKRQRLTVQVASQALPIGTHSGLISFTGDANAQVRIALTIVSPGNLAISSSSLAFTPQQTTQTMSLQNNGGLPLDWTVQPTTNDQINWLSVTSPTSGTLAPGESVTVTVRIDPSNLPPGTHQGVLTLSAGDQTKQVSVSLVITETTPTPVPTPASTPIATALPTKGSLIVTHP